MAVVIETTLGDMTVDLFTDKRPRACLNFLKLCKMKYYNYNLFHTISRGFMAQTGDPTGTRNGGESIYGRLEGPSKRYFESEKNPRIKHTVQGLISFVGNEESMIGSQFFITLGEELTYLDDKHCVFGEVMEGIDVLELLNETICDSDDRPYKDVRITHVVILEDPFNDLKQMNIPSRSPSPSAERLQGGRIGADEDIDDTEGKTIEEIGEMLAEREAKARATILEMVGDLPDAEMAPPENVLFICKLNPVTTDDDLEIIFSRFGKIKSCEVIRDKKSGDSLQYAFVEFEEQKSCEDAYFKMDNVLIDDRRIHVDFSQSVSKIKWHGKGRGITTYDDSGRKALDDRNDIGKGRYKKNYDVNTKSGNSRNKNNQESLRRNPINDNHDKHDKHDEERSPEKFRKDFRSNDSYKRSYNDYQRNNDRSRPQNNYSRGGDNYSRGRDNYSRRDEFSRGRNDYSRGRNEYSRERNEYSRERNEHSRGRNEHLRGRNDYSRSDRSTRIEDKFSTIRKDDRRPQYDSRRHENSYDYSKSNDRYKSDDRSHYNEKSFKEKRKVHNSNSDKSGSDDDSRNKTHQTNSYSHDKRKIRKRKSGSSSEDRCNSRKDKQKDSSSEEESKRNSQKKPKSSGDDKKRSQKKTKVNYSSEEEKQLKKKTLKKKKNSDDSSSSEEGETRKSKNVKKKKKKRKDSSSGEDHSKRKKHKKSKRKDSSSDSS